MGVNCCLSRKSTLSHQLSVKRLSLVSLLATVNSNNHITTNWRYQSGDSFMYQPDLICFVHLSYLLWCPNGTCYQMGLEHPVSCIWCLTSCSGHLEKKIDSTYYLNGLISLGKHLWNLKSEDGHCYQHWTFSSMLQQGIWNNRNYRIPLYNNIHD